MWVGAACLGIAALAFCAPGSFERSAFPAPGQPKLHARHIHDTSALRPEPTLDRSAGLRVALGPGGRDVRLAGELVEGAAERLRDILDAHPGIGRIHLTSEGGLVEEGRAVGALIAAHGLDAYVPDYCVSACTLAFVRGRERLVRRESRLGFHAPYEDGPAGETIPVDASDERAAYLAAGLDPAFVGQALAMPASDLWIPDAARLLASRVATALVEADRFPDSTLDHAPDLAGARRALLNGIDGARALDDGALDAIAASYLAAYWAGRPEGEVAAEMYRLVAEAGRSGGEAARLAILKR